MLKIAQYPNGKVVIVENNNGTRTKRTFATKDLYENWFNSRIPNYSNALMQPVSGQREKRIGG